MLVLLLQRPVEQKPPDHAVEALHEAQTHRPSVLVCRAGAQGVDAVGNPKVGEVAASGQCEPPPSRLFRLDHREVA